MAKNAWKDDEKDTKKSSDCPTYVSNELKKRQKDGAINADDEVVSWSEENGLVSVITSTASFSFEKK